MLCDKCRHAEKCPAKAEHGGAIRCSAYKPQEQTNEEWLRSCPQQELIRFLMNVAYGGQIRNVQQSTFEEEAEKWSKWLKEKHDEMS